MCGFITFFSNSSLDDNSKDKLEVMLNSLKHRGPDEKGVYHDDKVFLGFCRLSIIDLENGKQPFSYDYNNYHIVFNGEIYNHVELRESLIKEGYTFSTKSEVEVILTLYKHYDEEFVKHLRGMFSIVIWDKLNQRLIAVRDQFGIKPLFYTENENGIYCTSESKSLLQSNIVNNKVDLHSLHDYLSFQFVPEPKTMLENIHILEPGCMLKKESNSDLKISRYASLRFSPEVKKIDERKSSIRKVLEDSVEAHMISDVPVATFLSGGIDSTIITALAKKINPKIKTFTVGFEVNGYSEIDLAQETASELNVENINITVSSEDFIKELPNVIFHMDNPIADPSTIPLYFVCQEASKHVKVVLSGEGSDELFGGYGIYHEPLSLNFFSYIPNAIKKSLKLGSSLIPEGVKGKSFIERGCTPLEERYLGNAKIFSQKEKAYFLKNYIKNFSPQLITQPLFSKVSGLDPVTQMQYIDINTWLKGDILAKADRMSMAHSLEIRVPFLDKEVFKVASKLTLSDKINRNTTKYLLRETFRDELPQSVVTRKKLGYPVPIRHWLKDELYEWAIDLVKEDVVYKYIDKEYIIKLINQHRKGKIDYSRKIWTILTFIIWYKIFIKD
ncbi:asparagine synthetase [Gottschalkia purinilytica]|uniref:asparagine synthase (glutamine-hydrolyzing) n=1 Tax=Gottschalkia purinilytica TaxID=1503 RepID=A0A0L0W8W2_GOTPU|nr:asparagine synthase (glutamine-hydrolyzing) [Gottschalkia purinilytica]KNF07745.1 asparagine synthetase [Gottschalkia purinilytica]